MQSNLLLCELRAHTTWSDGSLTMTELVDLYGRHGFDVLCVTDHLLRSDSRRFRLGHQTHAHYLATIRRESRRAREQYDLLLIPGLELTQLADDPDEAGTALALGLHTLCSVDDGLEPAMHAARDAGAAIVAAHPRRPGRSEPRAHHSLVRPELAAAGRPRRPVRALQPPADVRVGRRGRTAGDRHRRLPPARAPADLEDAAALRQERARRDRASPVESPRVRRPVGLRDELRRPLAA